MEYFLENRVSAKTLRNLSTSSVAPIFPNADFIPLTIWICAIVTKCFKANYGCICIQNYYSITVSVADPGSGAFLTPGSGMGERSGSGIQDENPGSYFWVLRNHFFGLKFLNSLRRIWDPGWKKLGSGMEKKSDPG
jgi:hypothetical protein